MAYTALMDSYNHINTCATSVFIYPVTEEEVVNMAKTLKNKQTAGPDDIPECLVKQCIGLIKKTINTYI